MIAPITTTAATAITALSSLSLPRGLSVSVAIGYECPGPGQSHLLSRLRAEVGQRGDAALQLLQRLAFEHAVAVLLVGAHDRVPVVPVELRLRVHPEGTPGTLRDRPKGLRVRF